MGAICASRRDEPASSLRMSRAIARTDDDRDSAAGYSAPVRALTSLGARVQALPPGRADLLLAGAFLLETQVELSFLDASTSTVLAARGLTLAMALGVAARRRAPLVAALLVFAALTGLEQLGEQVNTSLVGPFASAFIVSYTIGAHLEGRALAVGVGWLVALVTALSLLDPNADEGLNLVWGWLVIVAAPVLAGRLLRDRARLARELRAAAGDEDPEPWAEQAVAEERTRIAAELHDVVARALRRMVLDADGAARLVDRRPRPGGAGLRRRRADRARCAGRDPAPARRPAPRGRRAGARPAADARPRRRPRPPRARRRSAGGAARRGRRDAAAGRHRPDGLPRRAGGAGRGDARWWRRGRDGHGPLRGRRGRPRGGRRRLGAAGADGDRRARRALRRRAEHGGLARDAGHALRARLPFGSAA